MGGVKNELVKNLNSDGLWGMTLCITEAYGDKEIDSRLMNYFNMNDGSLSLIDKKKNEQILTNFEGEEEDTCYKLVKKIEVSDRLFLLDERNYGTYAYAADVSESKCKVRLETGRLVDVEYENLIIVA